MHNKREQQAGIRYQFPTLNMHSSLTKKTWQPLSSSRREGDAGGRSMPAPFRASVPGLACHAVNEARRRCECVPGVSAHATQVRPRVKRQRCWHPMVRR